MQNKINHSVSFITKSESETFALGIKFAEYLVKNNSCFPYYVSLIGEMGSGKTAFVKGVLNGLGYQDRVTSPSYALCNRYDCGLTIYHIDLYRLSSADDVFTSCIADTEDGDILLIEWAKIAEDCVPFNLYVSFCYGDGDTCRIITFSEDVISSDN